jgi:hypothetical protein
MGSFGQYEFASGERHQPGVPVNPQLLKIYDAATEVDNKMDAWILFLCDFFFGGLMHISCRRLRRLPTAVVCSFIGLADEKKQ